MKFGIVLLEVLRLELQYSNPICSRGVNSYLKLGGQLPTLPAHPPLTPLSSTKKYLLMTTPLAFDKMFWQYNHGTCRWLNCLCNLIHDSNSRYKITYWQQTFVIYQISLILQFRNQNIFHKLFIMVRVTDEHIKIFLPIIFKGFCGFLFPVQVTASNGNDWWY